VTTRNAARRALATLAVAALAVTGAAVGVLVAAAPASAHNWLVSTVPAENETLTSLPERFGVTTNDVLLDLTGEGSGNALQIEGPDGRQLFYGDGCSTLDGVSLWTKAALGAPGEYQLLYRIVSADGHPVSGSIPFQWQPAAGQPQSPGSPTPPACGEATGQSPGQPAGGASATPGAPATPGAEATGGGSADTGGHAGMTHDDGLSGSLGDFLWIAAAVLVVAAAVVLTVVFARRRRTGPSAAGTAAETPSAEGQTRDTPPAPPEGPPSGG